MITKKSRNILREDEECVLLTTFPKETHIKKQEQKQVGKTSRR